MAELETTRQGQLRLAVLPDVQRQPHPTGQQALCVPCTAAGLAKLGVSRYGPDSPPLCRSCWRSDRQRQARAAARDVEAQGWAELGAAASACPVCGPGSPPAAGCWWCGDRTWLDGLRWVHEQDQAAAAAAEAARVDAEFARLAAVAETEARIEDLTKWITRIRRDVLARWHAGSGGLAVERAAAALAAMHAARTTTRGRPPAARESTAVVLAIDADWRSGRRAMPGQARAALLSGWSARAVFGAIQYLIKEAGFRQTYRGGRNTLARRVATGRWNDRSVYDLPPLGRSAAARGARAAWIPRVLELIADLLDRAESLLAAAYVELDRLRAAAGPPSWAEHAARAQDRQATRRAAAEARTLAEASAAGPNKCDPHPVSKGECVSSCSYRGLYFPRPMIHSPECPAEPAAGRRRQSGASRSPARERRGADHATCGTSPRRPEAPAQRRPPDPFPARREPDAGRRRARPAWSIWAGDLARELIPAVPWLAAWSDHDRRHRVAMVAATLGPRLGPEWTAAAVLASLPLDAEPDSPLALLAAALDRALTSDQAPPYPARRHDEHRRAAAADAHAVAAAQLAATLADLDERAAASTGAGLDTFRAARAQLGHQAPADEAWPAVAPPGAGLPIGWRHGADHHDQAADAADTTPRSSHQDAATHRHTWRRHPRTEGDHHT